MTTFVQRGAMLPPALGSIIDSAAAKAGLDPKLLRAYAVIESGGNPTARTGGYHGLFQLSTTEFAKYGHGTDIYNPGANADAAAYSLKDRMALFAKNNGRNPTATELYLAHQQGDGGLAAHMAHPDQPAWVSMRSTGEGENIAAGRQHYLGQTGPAAADRWAHDAIWGNVPKDARGGLTAETITSKQFMNVWGSKVEGTPYTPPPGGTVVASTSPSPAPVASPSPAPDGTVVASSPPQATTSETPPPSGTPIGTYQGQNPYNNYRAPTPETNQQQADRIRAEPTPYTNFWDTATAAAQSDWATSWAIREMGAQAPDGNFSMSLNRANEVTKDVPEQYHDFVINSRSEGELAARLQFAQEDSIRQQKLAAGGWSAAGIRLLTDVIDPTFVAATALTEGLAGPISALASTSRAGRVLFEAGVNGVSNAAATAATATVNPNITEGDVAASFGLGAVLGGTIGALRRNPATALEANNLANIGRSIINDNKAALAGGGSSVGASRTPGFRPDLLGGEVPTLDDANIPKAALGRWRFDATGQLGASKDPISRLFGAFFGEEAVGFSDRSVVPDSATINQHAIDMKNVGDWKVVAYPAFQKWAQDNGRYGYGQRRAAFQDFMQQVGDYVEQVDPPVGTHASIVSAAGSFRKVMANYASLMENPLREKGGVGRPIIELPKDDNYFAKYANHERINELINTHGYDGLERFAVQAVLDQHPDMPAAMADRIGKGWLKNIVKGGYNIEDGFSNAIAEGDHGALREMLGMSTSSSEEEIQAVLDQLDGLAVKKDGVSGFARTRRRTPMNYTYTNTTRAMDGSFKELSMRDFFVQDADWVMRRYSRQTSGRVALAQIHVHDPQTGEVIFNGITKKSEFQKLTDWVRNSWATNDAHKALTFEQRKAGADHDVENFKYLYDAITSTPHYNTASKVYQWMSRIRKAAFLVYMNRLGLNQAQEFMRMMGTLGVKAMWSQMPSLSRVINEAGQSVVKGDRMLQELQAATGKGLNMHFGQHEFHYDDELVGAPKSGRIGRKIDDLLATGQKLTADYSLMTHIHGLQQNWTIKAISQRLYDMAAATNENGVFNLQKLGGKELSKLRAIGMGDEDLQKVFGAMLQHGETPSGSKLVGLNLDNWEPATRARFVNTMLRWTDRIIHENDAGTLNRWMSQPMVKMMTQFRNFTIGSWAKSTLYNIHNFDARTFATMSLELLAGWMSWAIVQGLGAGPADPAATAAKIFDPTNMIKAGVGRAAFTSLIPGAVDTGLSFAPWGPAFDFRSSGNPNDFLFGSVTGSYAKSVATFTKGLINAGQGRGFTKGTARAGASVLPFGNWLPFTAVTGLMTKGLPDTLSSP